MINRTLPEKKLTISIVALFLTFVCVDSWAQYISDRPVRISKISKQVKINEQVWGGETEYVILVDKESGSGGNDHPFYQMSVEDMAYFLSGIKVTDVSGIFGKSIFGEEQKYLFANKDIKALAKPIIDALERAGANEDVLFQLFVADRFASALSGQQVLNGRIFVQDGELNIIFGELFGDFSSQIRATGIMRNFKIASRNKPAKINYEIMPNPGELQPSRKDWLTLASYDNLSDSPRTVQQKRIQDDLREQDQMNNDTVERTRRPPREIAREESVAADQQIAAHSAAVTSVQSTPSVSDQRKNSIKERLTFLKSLWKEGVISEDDYDRKVKEILNEL